MDSMLYPDTEIEVSVLALGCMNLGGSWDDSPLSKMTLRKAEKAVMTAVEQGITLFDHADIYCFGKSEEAFGAILRTHPRLRSQIRIQTKCGIRLQDTPAAGAPARYDSSRRHIVESLHASLRRLQVDQIDVLLLHRPDPLMETEEVAAAFDELEGSGKVRYFGVSNHSWEQVDRLQAAVNHRLIVNQLRLSLGHSDLIWNGVVFNQGNREAGPTLDPALRRRIQIQAWGPLDQGRLLPSGKADKRPTTEVARLISRIAKDRGLPAESVALAWLLRHPARIQPVIGTTNPNRIRASAFADQIELNREEWYSLLTAARGQELP